MASKRWVSTDTVMGSIMGSSGQPAADVDLGGERAMDRALAGDLQQSGPLLTVESPRESDLAVDPVEPALLRLALGAIDGVDLGVLQAYLDRLERPLLASRIQRERHRGSGSQRDEQVVVGRGAGIGPAGGRGLVSRQAVPID